MKMNETLITLFLIIALSVVGLSFAPGHGQLLSTTGEANGN